MDEDPKERHRRFAADLKALNREGLSLEQLSRRIGRDLGLSISRSTLGESFTATRHVPTWRTVEAIVTVFSRDAADLEAVLAGWRERWTALRATARPAVPALASRMVETAPRPSRRLALLLAAFGAAALLVAVILVVARGDGEAGAPAGPPATTWVAPVLWTRLTGPGCPGDHASFFLNSTEAGDKWTDTTGGYGREGCLGSAVYSASPGESGPAVDSIVWHYDVPEGVPGLPDGATLTCRVSVYVPDSPFAVGLAKYWVSTKALEGDSQTILPGSQVMRVDQSATRGTWVDLGLFTSPDRTFALTGADDISRAGRTVAMSAARLEC